MNRGDPASNFPEAAAPTSAPSGSKPLTAASAHPVPYQSSTDAVADGLSHREGHADLCPPVVPKALLHVGPEPAKQRKSWRHS